MTAAAKKQTSATAPAGNGLTVRSTRPWRT